MSRRARSRLDKWEEAFELARLCGHGTEFKGEGEEESPPYDPAEFDITEPDTRVSGPARPN